MGHCTLIYKSAASATVPAHTLLFLLLLVLHLLLLPKEQKEGIGKTTRGSDYKKLNCDPLSFFYGVEINFASWTWFQFEYAQQVNGGGLRGELQPLETVQDFPCWAHQYIGIPGRTQCNAQSLD